MFRMAKGLRFVAATEDRRLLKALDLVLQNEHRKTEWIADEVDLSFASERWRKPVCRSPGLGNPTNRRYLEVCVVSHLAGDLRCGDVCIEGSGNFADLRQQLMPSGECQAMLQDYCDRIGLACSCRPHAGRPRRPCDGSRNAIAVFRHFIPPGVLEAIYVIEGLLKAGLSVQADTVYSDTHGRSEAVFAFTYLNGIQLMPRIRNWKDLRFYKAEKGVRYKHINRLFTDVIDWKLIRNHWKDLIVANPSAPFSDVASLVAQAKGKPNAYSYASAGNGNTMHIAGEHFLAATGTKLMHVPYRGGAAAMNDVLAGQVPLMFNNLPSVVPFVNSGKLRGLAVADNKRSPILPDVPTMAEAGVPGYTSLVWTGILVRKGTPPAIVASLSREMSAVLKASEFRAPLEAQSFDILSSTPEAFEARIQKEYDMMGALVKRAGIHID